MASGTVVEPGKQIGRRAERGAAARPERVGRSSPEERRSASEAGATRGRHRSRPRFLPSVVVLPGKAYP